MEIERRKYLFEIFGQLAVVGTLIFLALEVRQNTNAIKATAIQEYTASSREHLALYVSDAELAEIIVKANTNLDDLSPAEAQRFIGFNAAASLHSQGAYRQWRLGVLPDEEWSVELAMLCADRKLPSAKVLDDLLSPLLTRSFIEMIEKECRPNKE